MSEADWNPWKMATFSLLLVGTTALVTTLVMGYRDDHVDVKQTRTVSPANASMQKVSVPSQIDVEACQSYAQQRTGDKTVNLVKDVAIGGVGSAGVGAAGGAIDTQYQTAYRSCMRQKGY